MAQVIYNYPKSSCKCRDCEHTKPISNPTDMSVSGCISSDLYDCNNKHQFKVQQEPTNKTGKILLNPPVVSQDKYDKTFRVINVDDCPGSACVGTTFLNSDPRLYNAASNTWLQLDKPPLNSTQKLNTLNSDKSLNKYGQVYKSYADITGHTQYYIDKQTEDTHYEPLFSKKATVIGTMYKDPMGVLKPQYERIPKENPCEKSGDYCLSFMRDTQYHREDLLSRQMSKIFSERYAPRWTNINK
jgi:hypothetical protein